MAGSQVSFNNAFVSSVTPSTKYPSTAYVDLIGPFGQVNMRTSSANVPQLQQLQAAGQPVNLRCDVTWRRYGKDMSIIADTIQLVQGK